MKAGRVFWTILMLALLIGGTAFYLTPRLIQATPLSNASGEPRSLSDLVNFTKISKLTETTLTPLSTDWENALATIQRNPGSISVYSEACSKYSCPGGSPLSLTNTPQTLLPQKAAPSPSDSFGYSVAGVGSNVLIGVPYNRTAGLSQSGAAYLFDKSGTLLATYHEPSPAAGDSFGFSVAELNGQVLIGSPDTWVSGVPQAGAAYLFDTSGNVLRTFHEPTVGSYDRFGRSVAAVGSNILVGSPSSNFGGFNSVGQVYLFDNTGNLLTSYLDPDWSSGGQDEFGFSIAAVGGNILVGAPNDSPSGLFQQAGAAYLFDSGGYLLKTFNEPIRGSNDYFGLSVAGVGANILIGSYGTTVGGFANAGAAYLFATSGNLLVTYHEPVVGSNDDFGYAVAAVSGNVLIGATGTSSFAGSVYLYDNNGSFVTSFNEPMRAANDQFGAALAAVAGDILIGSPNTGFSAGEVYLFDSSGNSLKTFQKPMRPPRSFYGTSLAAMGTSLVIGAPGDNNNAGTVYILDSNGAITRRLQKPVPTADDNFGQSVATLGSSIVVGAPGESSVRTSGGAVYVFDASGNLLTSIRKPGVGANDYFGWSIAVVGNGILVGVKGNATGGQPAAGAAYLFDSNGNLLKTFREPQPSANDNFGYSVAGVGSGFLIGSPGTFAGGYVSAGAAYLFDSNGNLSVIYHEPTASFNDNFGYSLTGVAGGILIGSPYTTVGGLAAAGSAYLFNTSGALIRAFYAPSPGFSNADFGVSVATVGGNLLIGGQGTPQGGFNGSGAAYVFDSNGNLLRAFHEPVLAPGDSFGWSVAAAGTNILIGAPYTTIGSSLYSGVAYLYRQFGLRDSCAAATGTDCVVVSEVGTFQAGPNPVAVNVVAVSLRSALNATLGTQMALTGMCNTEVTDAGLQCSAFYVEGNVWGPARDTLKGPFIIVNAEPYFYLQWHWWDAVNQRIASWSYWWYGTNPSPNWYWSIYLWWRTYVASNLGVWTPWWWWSWSWMYWRYWDWWGTNLQNIS